ncbi:MAG: hypothetical protein RL648_1638, partial [Verrucomicrobiota bacterium]
MVDWNSVLRSSKKSKPVFRAIFGFLKVLNASGITAFRIDTTLPLTSKKWWPDPELN